MAAWAEDAAVTATNAIQPAATIEPAPPLTNASASVPLRRDSPRGTINSAGSFGLGPLLGEPTGLGAKVWLSEKTAVDAGMGWGFADPDGFQLHSDFLFHAFDLFHTDSGQLPLYFGVGGRVKFVDQGDNRAGIRGPVGVSYLFPNSRWEAFGEVVPVLDLAPSAKLRWNGGVGFRFYF
jgi:hypothetical protein